MSVLKMLIIVKFILMQVILLILTYVGKAANIDNVEGNQVVYPIDIYCAERIDFPEDTEEATGKSGDLS